MKQPCVLAMGGGKGGVGKTIIATMIGIELAHMGKKVVMLDADFAGANLNGYLNNFCCDHSLEKFFYRQSYDLNELVQKTIYLNLNIISGVSELFYASRFRYNEKKKLLANVRHLDADYVILDLGAGIHFTILDFFLFADKNIIVTSSDSLSLQDAYGFLRAALFRKLEYKFKAQPEFFQQLKSCGDLSKGRFAKSIKSIIQHKHSNPEAWISLLHKTITDFRPKVILNLVREDEPTPELQALRLTASDLLGVKVDDWGVVRYDPVVGAAVRNLRPELLMSKEGRALKDISSIVEKHIYNPDPVASTSIPDSYAESEEIRYDSGDAKHSRICNYRCIAWNCCPVKTGGMPCTLMTPASLAKVG